MRFRKSLEKFQYSVQKMKKKISEIRLDYQPGSDQKGLAQNSQKHRFIFLWDCQPPCVQERGTFITESKGK